MREGLNLDYALLIPEYLLGLLAIVIIAADMLLPRMHKQMLPVITGAGLIGIFVVSLVGYVDTTDDFAGLILIDDFTTFFRCFFLATTFVVVVFSAQFVQEKLRNPGEYYALLATDGVFEVLSAPRRPCSTMGQCQLTELVSSAPHDILAIDRQIMATAQTAANGRDDLTLLGMQVGS